jgi:hypothetical protein
MASAAAKVLEEKRTALPPLILPAQLEHQCVGGVGGRVGWGISFGASVGAPVGALVGALVGPWSGQGLGRGLGRGLVVGAVTRPLWSGHQYCRNRKL